MLAPKTRAKLGISVALSLSYFVLGLLQTPAYLKIDPWATPADAVLASAILSLLLFPAAYIGSRLAPMSLPMLSRGPRDAKGVLRELARMLPYTLALAALAFALNMVLSGFFTWTWEPPTAQDYVARFSALDKILTSVSSGVWEETVFRLFLVSAGFAIIRRKVIACVLANSLFTLMHVIFQHPPYNSPALVIVFAVGLVYTKCYLKRGLESAILCHATMNMLTMTLGTLL